MCVSVEETTGLTGGLSRDSGSSDKTQLEFKKKNKKEHLGQLPYPATVPIFTLTPPERDVMPTASTGPHRQW